MKRIAALILAAAMMLAPCSFARAAKNIGIIVNETYNDCITNTVPKGISTDGDGSVIYVSAQEQGKALYMRHRWSDTSVRVNAAAQEEVVWIDTKILVPDGNSSRDLIEVDNNDTSAALVTLSRSGGVSDTSGREVCRVTKNEWHRYSAAVNLITSKYDIYVDGVKRAERITLAEPMDSITAVGFTARANAEAESELYNKYLRVYTADELPAENEIEEAAYNHEVKKLRKAEVKEVKNAVVMYYNDDFEEVSVGGRPAQVTPTIGSQMVESDEGGNYYALRWSKGSGVAANYEVSKIGLANMPEKVVFEADVRAGKNTGDAYIFSLRDAGNPYSFSRIVRIMADGTVAAYNGTPLGGANCKNKWVSVAIISDFKSKTHDIYIDKKLVTKGLPFQSSSIIRKMSMLRFHVDSESDKGELDLDNMRIYSGGELVGEDTEITSGVVRMPEKPEIWEHEIDAAPLNINMRDFAPAVEYQSKSPSNFLKDYSAGKNTFAGTVVLDAGNSNLWIYDKKYTSPYKIMWDDKEHFIAPAAFLAALSGETAAYADGKVTIGGDFEAAVGENAVKINGTEYETGAAVQLVNGEVYVPVREYVIYRLKKYYCESFKGLAVIADRQINLKQSSNTDSVIQMLAYLNLDLPNVEKLRNDYEASALKGVHPRIYAGKERYEEVLKLAETDEVLKERVASILEFADSSLNLTFTNNKTSGVGTFDHCEAFYIAYLKTGDEKYAKKAEELALLIANDPEWNEKPYFLGTSFDMQVLSTVYDLFYDYLSEQSKKTIGNAVIEKGIKATLRAYDGKLSDWPLRKTNWNTVCNGGSMVAAATFLGEGFDDNACLELLEKSFVSLSYELHAYAPYGSLFESIGYWGYGTGYLLRGAEAVERLFGTDYGISNYAGYSEMAYFPFYMETWQDKWALHDDTLKSGINVTVASYFAYKNKDMLLQKMRAEQIKRKKYKADLFDVIYYMPGEMPEKITAPLDKNYSYSELASSRSDWGRSAFYLGVHAGANDFEHGQQDLGNFIYEAFGIRFAHDIGRDSYDLPNYFNEGTTKLNYYVHRAEAHNVYVINPDESSGQVWHAKSEIETVEEKPKGVIYTVDMTPAYFEQIEEGKRGYMLTNDRSVLVVQDEIVPKEADDEFKWFWTTEANITVNEDKTVTLTKDRKTVTLYFDSNVDFELEAGAGEPLPTSPNPAGQLQIGNKANRLCATFYSEEDTDKIYFRCIAVPYGHDDYTIGEIEPIDSWSIPDGDIYSNYVNADSILINGVPLESFSPDVYDYTVYYAKHEGLPEVGATADGSVSVRQAEDKYKTAVVTVTSAAGVRRIYTVTFRSDIASGVPDGTKLEVRAVTAQDSDDNLPEYAVDGDLNTRWSGKSVDEGWIVLDLGEVKTFDAIALAIFKGDTRAAFFDISVSADGNNYTKVITDGMTSGTTTGLEYVRFPAVEARYVRLDGHGATTSRYNSYTEIQVYKTE